MMYGPTQRGKSSKSNASTIIAFVENVFPLQSIKEQEEEEGMGLKKTAKEPEKKEGQQV